MKEMIINHTNNDHMDALVLLVQYYNKKENVENAKMTDVDNKGMKMLVNGSEETTVYFTKDVELKEVKDELITMLKTAREALGIKNNNYK